MKTIKVITAILLILVLLPISISSCSISVGIASTEEKVSDDADIYLAYPDKYEDYVYDIEILKNSANVLSIFTFLGLLSAIVIIFTTLKRRYLTLISGGILLIIMVWSEVNKHLIANLENNAIGSYLIAVNNVYLQKDWLVPYDMFYATNHYNTIQTLLFLPTLTILVMSLIRFLILQIKKRKVPSGVLQTKIVQGENEGTLQTEKILNDNFEQIKQYKDLLNKGIITQEEFNAKKKELLGL